MRSESVVPNLQIDELRPSTGYERLLRCRDQHTGLDALISVHSTHLGPAAGGCRMWSYQNLDAAIEDVERLSKGMSYKNAAADLPLGGGKSVIIGDAKSLKTADLMRSFGRFVEHLGGQYYTAEDVGITPVDMAYAAEHTAYVAGLEDGEFASGDPSPVTARGVYLCMRAAVALKLRRDSLAGVRVAIQGLGSVGMALAASLHADEAVLFVTDKDPKRVALAVEHYGAVAIAPDDIYAVPADVFCPCALGGILSPAVISSLNVSVVAGAANNQLLDESCGALLSAADILYAPDYIVNGGGIVNAAMEILGISDTSWGERRVTGLVDTLMLVLNRAAATGESTNRVADAWVQQKLEGNDD